MNGSDGNPQTPFQEAISLITIVAILVGVGAYVAALKNVPLLSPALFWVAVQIYNLFPALTRLPGSQVPMLVAAGAVGTAFFIFTIPLAYWSPSVFNRAGISSMDRQTLLLKRMRNATKKRMIDNDKFDVVKRPKSNAWNCMFNSMQTCISMQSGSSLREATRG